MPVTSRQKKFILEYLKDLNATKAAERAGYKHPQVQGSQLLAKPKIKAEIDSEKKHRSDRLKLDCDWVIKRLQAEADDRNNTASARIRALELIGKHLGVFEATKIQVRYSGTIFADA
jgi:phage terminase small subunit